MRRLLLCLVGLVLLAPTLAGQRPAPVTVEVKFDFNRWPWPLYQEVAARLQELPKLYPKLARTSSIGKSGEGRDLLVIELTNADTGPGDAKPAMWMDGNIHAGELWGRQGLLHAVEKWLASYGKDPEITRLFDTRTLYVLPMFDVDGGERVLTRHPAWPGHKPEQHAGKDLDGDGYITQMRVKDPNGSAYPSPIDPRVMLQIRDRWAGVQNFIPTTWEEPETFEEDLAPRDQRYRIYTEGASLDRPPVTVEREPANFNRNWSAEWKPDEPGAGPFPFSLPEVHAVATFMTTHKNIFFQYTMHSGGGARNYQVRPLMNHPYDDMPPEDNEFYVRVGAVWSDLSNGGVMNNNWYGQEVKTGRFGYTMAGFANDWAYLQLGIHTLLPEIHDPGKDYDGDGYVTTYEIMRWNDEEQGGKYFAPWKPYKHPVLGDVEIGGSRGWPTGVGERFKAECETHYRLLTHIAGLSPLLRIKDLTSRRLGDGTHRVVTTLQNQGFLSTYVTRWALKSRRDYPIVASLKVTGGEVVGGPATKTVGHILGRLAYLRRWGAGADESTKNVEWTVKPAGAGPVTVTVDAWAHKAGRDQKTLTLKVVTDER